MAVVRTKENVATGYADIYIAPEDEAIPGSTGSMAAPGVNYQGVGFTETGLDLEVSRDIEDIKVEEQLTPVDIVVTGAQVMVKFTMAEDLIENRKIAYGGGTLSTTAAGVGQIGKKTLVLSETLEKHALLFDCDNVYGFTTRVHIPSVASVGSVGTPFKRAEKRVYPVEFRALCALTDITIIEQTAAAS